MGYGHVLERQRVIDAARAALSQMGCITCRVFVMSNCRDEIECAPIERGMLGGRVVRCPTWGARLAGSVVMSSCRDERRARRLTET